MPVTNLKALVGKLNKPCNSSLTNAAGPRSRVVRLTHGGKGL